MMARSEKCLAPSKHCPKIFRNITDILRNTRAICGEPVGYSAQSVKNDYNQKLESIIHDRSKFEHITRNPVPELKVKINKLITDANK